MPVLIRPPKAPATLKQRIALTNMHNALGWEVKGIRDLSKQAASEKIDYAMKYIEQHGFPNKANGIDHNGVDLSWPL